MPILAYGLIFLTLGCVLLGGALYSADQSYKRTLPWKAAEGTVVRVEEPRPMQVRASPPRMSIIAFSSPRGQIEFEGVVYPVQRTGAVVKVLFNPDDPSQACVDSPTRWFGVLVVGVLGAVFAGTGALITFFGLFGR